MSSEPLKIFKLFYYLPESYVLVLASLTYLGLIYSRKKLYLFSFIFGLSTFLLRDFLFVSFGYPQGFHTVFLVLLNFSLFKVLFKQRFLIAVLCDLMYFVTIMAFEAITFGFLNLCGVPLSHIVSSYKYYNFFGFINLFFISLFIYFLRKKEFVLIPIEKYLEEKYEKQI